MGFCLASGVDFGFEHSRHTRPAGTGRRARLPVHRSRDKQRKRTFGIPMQEACPNPTEYNSLRACVCVTEMESAPVGLKRAARVPSRSGARHIPAFTLYECDSECRMLESRPPRQSATCGFEINLSHKPTVVLGCQPRPRSVGSYLHYVFPPFGLPRFSGIRLTWQ